MVNFNEGTERFNKFQGAEKKITVDLNGVLYMVKMPDPIREKKLQMEMSYKNNQFSEHVGCRVFESCGFVAQETLLGYFTTDSGKRKTVVGCRVFTGNGFELIEMKSLANATPDSDKKMRTKIEDVYYILDNQSLIENKQEIKNRFWDMFVIDALIGNTDRHLGNWGLLEKGGEVAFAPIYDCGSSLGALLDEEMMRDNLEVDWKFTNAEKNVYSIYSFENKRVLYHQIFKKPPLELQEAILRMVPKINFEVIGEIIDSTPEMTDTHRDYMKKAMELRYKDFIFPAYRKLIKGVKHSK